MTQIINEIINQEREKTDKLKKVIERRYVNINSDDFKSLMFINIDKILAERNLLVEFEINDINKQVMNQLYYHLIGNKEKFNGNMQKGIMIAGKNGVGKTLILKAYCDTRNMLYGRSCNTFNSRKLVELIRENGYDNFIKREIMIDDIGKESREIVDFGTKIQPIADLIAFRYDKGSLTFATTNYKIDTLSEFYGLTTTDRMIEMFNIIEMEGESFRK